ncbi:ABC transporter permease [Thiomonas bhubaneswarensis]|uniref:ABC-type spermidine/putrescine transport system, permease component II n=1 Tax=Thiomonas bhubaneswarensis TaxID=339866 RepID=A0A0K6HS49_9BURK|nr:ABC transporter permease [Thiomonas bhubaneswarensis]CUA93750.1 ABC-type spermidine/putrescine transport system, permease component II [Thiomonas bhubaneswarensis]
MPPPERFSPPVHRPSRAWGQALLQAYTWLLIALVLVPIAVMVVYSFNHTPNGRVTLFWHGFTLFWYAHAFGIADLTSALLHSLEIGFASTAIALLLGTPMALAMGRWRFRGKAMSDLLVFIDIAAPSVVVGASLLSFFIALNVPQGLLTILIAHVAFELAFVVAVVRARVSGLDRLIDRAAADLGATPWQIFRHVTFPLILPGVVAAGALAFGLSIDDVIITNFVAGPKLTFPLWVYGAVKIGIPPQVFVLSTLIFLGGLLLAAANWVYSRRRAVV